MHRGLAAVQARGLTYDLLIRARELPAAVDTVRKFPGLQFVLDHIAKPRIADGRDDPWSQRMPALAAQPNVAVKLSGMVTEADWATWSARDLRPFVSQVAEWFGVQRLMFGSDWPVCLLAGSYHAVLGGLIDALPAMSPAELDQVLGLNALRIYQLDKRALPSRRRQSADAFRPGSILADQPQAVGGPRCQAVVVPPIPGICQRLRAPGSIAVDAPGACGRSR